MHWPGKHCGVPLEHLVYVAAKGGMFLRECVPCEVYREDVLYKTLR